jgi:hypothetical protein
VQDESAIEIGADELNFGGHAEPECRNGFRLRNGAITITIRSTRRRKINMKSAYELAMERLEKSAPTVQLTDAQKVQIAEIDSTYKARIAEKELFLQEKIRETRMAENYPEMEKLEAQLATELRRLQKDCEEKKTKLRATFGK